MAQTRREFLIRSSAAVAVAGVIPQTSQKASLTIVDCHQHLWPKWEELPWLEDGEPKLQKRFWVDEYRAAIGDHKVDAVYMEVDTAEADKDAEVERIAKLCQQDDVHTRAAVVGGFPGRDYFQSYAERHSKNPAVKGMRQVLHGDAPAGTCLESEFVRDVQLLGRLGLSFDLCMRPGELKDGATLAKRCYATRFIVDHCGNADPKAWRKPGDPEHAKASHKVDEWKRGIEALAAQPNVICKISGIIARVPKQWSAADLAPAVNHCLDTFGPDRVIFGSDWPVCLLGAPLLEWIGALTEIVADRTKQEREKLWFANARQFYGLK